MNDPIRLQVAGVSFASTYPENLLALQEVSELAEGEPIAAILVRRPDNPYDANAVEVHVPALGEDAMVGHLSRRHAATLAPAIDAGGRFQCSVYVVRVHSQHPDKPGLDIIISEAPEVPS
jgi:hypothetical protein